MSDNKSESADLCVRGAARTKKYSTIDYQTRKELIRRVLKEGSKLTDASRQLGIKLSTSKFILKSFKKYGRIFKKKSDATELSTIRLSDSEDSAEQRPPPETERVVMVYYPIYVYVPMQVPPIESFPNFDYLGSQHF